MWALNFNVKECSPAIECNSRKNTYVLLPINVACLISTPPCFLGYDRACSELSNGVFWLQIGQVFGKPVEYSDFCKYYKVLQFSLTKKWHFSLSCPLFSSVCLQMVSTHRYHTYNVYMYWYLHFYGWQVSWAQIPCKLSWRELHSGMVD